jgi:hypothetical protein
MKKKWRIVLLALVITLIAAWYAFHQSVLWLIEASMSNSRPHKRTTGTDSCVWILSWCCAPNRG